jgi:hypothetical protein
MEVRHRHLERHISAAAVIAGSLSTAPLEPRPQRTGQRASVSVKPKGARSIVRPLSAFLLLGLCPVIGLADAPLRAPSPVTVCSTPSPRITGETTLDSPEPPCFSSGRKSTSIVGAWLETSSAEPS